MEDINIVEFDEELQVYTSYNTIVPQICGEGTTKEEAVSNMIEGAKEFAKDYDDNIEVFSGVLNVKQQLLINNILLNLDDESKIMEMLEVV
jgi:hypothetical protein